MVVLFAFCWEVVRKQEAGLECSNQEVAGSSRFPSQALT